MPVAQDTRNRPTLLEVLALSGRLIWRPRRGFRRLYHATWAQLWFTQLLWAALLALLIGGVSFARAMYEEPQLMATSNVSGVSYDDFTKPFNSPTIQTPAKTWERLHPDGAFGEFEIEILLSTLLALVTNMLLLAAFWQEHYRGLAVGECLRRLLGATTAATGYGVVLIVALELVMTGVHYVDVYHTSQMLAGLTYPSAWYFDLLHFSPILSFALFVWLGLRRVAFFVRAARPLAPRTSEPPLCEACGYDLTHMPADNYCPECGQAQPDAEHPERRRPDIAWERAPTWGNFPHTLLHILLRPVKAHYGRLHLNSSLRAARRFAGRNYFVLGLAAGLFVPAAVLTDSYFQYRRFTFFSWVDVAGGAMVTSALLPLVCWSIYRGVAFMAFVITCWRRAVSAPHRTAKALHYETAYLWLPALWLVLMFASTLIFRTWFTDFLTSAGLIRPAPFFRGIPEIILFFAGLVLLVVVWVFRFRRIIQAIRYANQ